MEKKVRDRVPKDQRDYIVRAVCEYYEISKACVHEQGASIDGFSLNLLAPQGESQFSNQLDGHVLRTESNWEKQSKRFRESENIGISKLCSMIEENASIELPNRSSLYYLIHKELLKLERQKFSGEEKKMIRNKVAQVFKQWSEKVSRDGSFESELPLDGPKQALSRVSAFKDKEEHENHSDIGTHREISRLISNDQSIVFFFR